MNAGIYARRSQADERAGSVPGQLKRCRTFAHSQGWSAHEFVDDGVSGWDTAVRRDGYGAMLDAVRLEEIDVVIIDKPDRLTRQDTERAEFERLYEARGLRMIYLSDGTAFDLGTATGRRNFRDAGTSAAYYSDLLSERVLAAVEELAEGGWWSGGARPFGYDTARNGDHVTLMIRDAEATMLRDLYAAVLDGRTLKGLARGLNDRGILTARGNRWTTTSLRQTLLAPRNAGLRVHRGDIAGKANWKPVVDRRTWSRAVAVLTDPARTITNRGTRYLLAGRVYCGEEGARLIGRPMSGERYYVCVAGTEKRTKAEKRGKHVKSAGTVKAVHLGIKATMLEDYVLERAWSAEPAEPMVVRNPAEVSAPLLAERDAIDERISHWNREAAKAGLTAVEIMEGRADLVAERERIERDVEALATTAEPGVYERLWAEANRDPRDVVETVVDGVVVGSAGGRGRWARIADRVQIVWRAGVRPPTEAELAEAREEARGEAWPGSASAKA